MGRKMREHFAVDEDNINVKCSKGTIIRFQLKNHIALTEADTRE